ncbi:MAG TPA: HEAT repeat domain-containing protein [Vicinamibacteria bacterium]|nr:HEAT repeat domain-containing protein [Vicinamibacteria bacterium]
MPRDSGAAAKPSFEDLVANLKSPNAKTREAAAVALGKSGRRDVVASLAALVRDPEPRVRLEVARALSQLKDPTAIPALVTALGDGDPQIREEAIGGMVGIYADRERVGPVDRFLRVFSDELDRPTGGLYGRVDPAVIQGLARSLRDENKATREEAALALGILDGKGAIADLQTALADPDADVRGAAATALGKIGTAKDGRALIPLLADDSYPVKLRALHALGTLRVQEAAPPLREMYEANRRREIGLKVLETLSRIGDSGQAELFQQLIQDPDPEKKRLGIEGLARISDPSRMAAFKKDYQREGNQELKLAYAFAITRMGDHAFLDSLVLSLPARTVGSRSRGYILELGSDVLPELFPYLNDPDAEIRAQLCDIIAILGDPEAASRLTPLLNDPSGNVSDRANRAIEHLRRLKGARAGQ